MISYILLVSRQGVYAPETRSCPSHDELITDRGVVCPVAGKVRLQKWFVTQSSKVKQRIVRDVTQLVLARKPRQCNFLEYQGTVISFFPHWFSPTQSLRVPIHLRTNSVDPYRFKGDLPPLRLVVFRVWRDGRRERVEHARNCAQIRRNSRQALWKRESFFSSVLWRLIELCRVSNFTF